MADMEVRRKGGDQVIVERLRATPAARAVAAALGNQIPPVIETRTLLRKGVRLATADQKARS